YGATPSTVTQLAGRQSIPLSQLQVPFRKLSNNVHAEILTKAAGRKVFGAGTWEAGLRALSDKLTELGVDSTGTRMVDGSGLSRMDLVSAGQLASLLMTARSRPWFQSWYDALPVAGNHDRLTGGTLRNRMGGTPAANNVHAKTGSLTAVSALSGYVTAANGEKLVFSLLENNFLADSVTDVEDAVAVRLASYGGAGSSAAAHPLPPREGRALRSGHRAGLECSWTKMC
ncbi:MAG: D-alanyl-D-alanine carboxypeptidase/D-alanyl-D-alanine-endopeptidase, partial [Kutzneria sp.]|nr:D-alanyl-D-alanine carboxypeptidase/D-alanyl-D-alanine-endopeptidase [Kutzneria sp.]